MRVDYWCPRCGKCWDYDFEEGPTYGHRDAMSVCKWCEEEERKEKEKNEKE